MKKLLILSLMLVHFSCFSQEGGKHPIDIEMEKCLDLSQNQTTAGMSNCVKLATQKWDNELNVKYQKLLKLLTDEQKEQLKVAQREWIKYRDKELEFSNQFLTNMQGMMWITVASETELNLIRQRAIDLENYLLYLQ